MVKNYRTATVVAWTTNASIRRHATDALGVSSTAVSHKLWIDKMQNTSHAVMSQRAEPADSLDFFPTPPWATRALCEWLNCLYYLKGASVWEPACGRGHMSRVLIEYFKDVQSSDIHSYGYGGLVDFMLYPRLFECDWIITNPPFNLAEKFALNALTNERLGVALLVRTNFLESVGRFDRLFLKHQPTDILQFTERVPMHKGRLDPKGSTATAYCWVVWRKSQLGEGTQFHWIPPCRKLFERPEDYVL